MTCDDVQHRLLDGAPAPGDDQHLASCEACRALRAAHEAALGLRALEPRRSPTVRKAAVVTRAGLVVAALVGVVTAALVRPRAEPPPSPPAAATVAGVNEADEWAAFVAFTRGLEQDLSRDVVTADPRVPSHGPLSSWVAPASTLPSLSLEN